MAEKLDKMPERRGGERKYPWDTWLDGNPWLITSDDWDCKDAHGFQGIAYGAAQRRGGKIESRFPNGMGGDCCIIRFIPNGRE